MRRQLVDAAVEVWRKPLEDVAQIDPGVVPVELGGLDQAHHHRSSLTGHLAAREEPAFSSDRPRTYLVFQMIVVEGDIAVFEEFTQRFPALEAVVQGSGRRTAVGHPT